MRSAVLGIASAIAMVWQLLPAKWRELFVTGLFILESRGNAKRGLKQLFAIEDRLDWVISERAMAYEGGIHPKHRLIQYHQFFVSNIAPGSKVLDIGCGNGAVARSIASQVADTVVVGVDRNLPRLTEAREKNTLPNLSFAEGDARRDLPEGHWDVIVLSNILEHIEDRVGLLTDIVRQADPDQFLIRVPHFERDWSMAMRKEVGANYFSDEEHFIEPTLAELADEIHMAGLSALKSQTVWGEIWMVCDRQT
ncbi:MAG: class I SAM-dependent methyltransferase [Pseudomonadota bacterium]